MESRGLVDGEEAASIGPLYLIIFANVEVGFRFAEVQCAADYLDIRYAFVPVTKATLTEEASSSSSSGNSALDTSRVFALFLFGPLASVTRFNTSSLLRLLIHLVNAVAAILVSTVGLFRSRIRSSLGILVCRCLSWWRRNPCR